MHRNQVIEKIREFYKKQKLSAEDVVSMKKYIKRSISGDIHMAIAVGYERELLENLIDKISDLEHDIHSTRIYHDILRSKRYPMTSVVNTGPLFDTHGMSYKDAVLLLIFHQGDWIGKLVCEDRQKCKAWCEAKQLRKFLNDLGIFDNIKNRNPQNEYGYPQHYKRCLAPIIARTIPTGKVFKKAETRSSWEPRLFDMLLEYSKPNPQ